MRAVFRVDSGSSIGAGHLSRCAVLAKELKRRGVDVFFVSRKSAGSLEISFFVKDIPQLWIDRENAFRLEALWPESEQKYDSDWINQRFQAQSIDVLIVDHYGLDHVFESSVLASRILIIDDLYNRVHSGDFILNQAAHHPNAYKNLNTKAHKELLGSDFALIREDLLTLKSQYDFEQNDHVLLYLGNGAVGEQVYEISKRLVEANLFNCITILLPTEDAYFSKIAELIKDRNGIRLLKRVDDFPSILRTVSLFIGANGATSWERCYLGIPTLSFTLAKNQEDIEYTLRDKQAAKVMGSVTEESLDQLLPALKQFQNKNYCRALSGRAKRVCDGQGVQRILKEMGL